MTYSSDFLLFYAYAVVVSGALLVSALTLTVEAASGSLRQWRLRRQLNAQRPPSGSEALRRGT